MKVSFGKFIPVKVFLDGKEVRNNPKSKIMDPDIKQVTLNMADCLSKDKTYPNNCLAEQQRRFFKSQVSDYALPRKTADNKSEILPSTVKTVNIDGQRYLITGADILLVQELGHELGVQQKKNSERTDMTLSAKADDMTYQEYQKLHKTITGMYNMASKAERMNALRDLAKKRSIPKTLYISASKNEDAKLKRDQYSIQYIDFKQ